MHLYLFAADSRAIPGHQLDELNPTINLRTQSRGSAGYGMSQRPFPYYHLLYVPAGVLKCPSPPANHHHHHHTPWGQNSKCPWFYGFTSCSRTNTTSSIVPAFLRSTSCGMTSARGHGAIVYCLNSGSEDRQTGRHNMLCEGETRNRWRDGQVCPDVGQGTMVPWARRLGREKKTGEREEENRTERGDGKRKGKETAKEKKRSRGEREEPALYGEKG
ncbi:hypothetical protein TNCV_724791 [Trichonephila clavipes]|nr:hypothetical protein TNCV_724791 [Trichonephila clavipes]